MLRYFYAWTPLVILGTVVLLSAPWFGLIALMIVTVAALIALAALTWAIVAAPYVLIRSLSHRWRDHAAVRTPRALTTGRQVADAMSVADNHKPGVVLASPMLARPRDGVGSRP